MKLRYLGLLVLAICGMAGPASSQDLEPRSFSQAPVGMNFAALSFNHATGEVLFDQATPITDANGRVNTMVAAYVRTLGLFGSSAKITAALPYSTGHWHGFLAGKYADTSRTGFSDPRLMLAVNFIGAPAIKMSEMRTYTNNTVVGASLQVVVPVGQYDREKLINLGQNRWALRPRLGASHKVGGWTLEVMADVWLFADNPDFLGGSYVTQEPLWSMQGNFVHQFRSGIWLGAGAGISRGGQTSSDGVFGDNYKKNTRWGILFSYPLSRTHSAKIQYINGLRTRLGSDFDQIGISYQVRWGGEQ